jgi:hypothetical protein
VVEGVGIRFLLYINVSTKIENTTWIPFLAAKDHKVGVDKE